MHFWLPVAIENAVFKVFFYPGSSSVTAGFAYHLPDSQQSKTLMTVDVRGSISLKNSNFDCQLQSKTLFRRSFDTHKVNRKSRF